MTDKPQMICLTGYTGSGKTTVKNMFAQNDGVKVFYTKDLHQYVLGRESTGNKMKVSTQLKDKNEFIRRIMEFIVEHKGDANVVVLDSVRSTDELDYIRTLPDFKQVSLVRVRCDDLTRIQRLKKRDNCDEQEILVRDSIDTGKDDMRLFNMNDLFKRSNYIVDTTKGLEDVNRQVYRILSLLRSDRTQTNTRMALNKRKNQR